MSKDNAKNEEAPGQNKEFTIIVEGQEKVVTDHKQSYAQIVQLFLGTATFDQSVTYTVTYRKGHSENSEGTMVAGDVVTIKNRMVFNVSPTTKS